MHDLDLNSILDAVESHGDRRLRRAIGFGSSVELDDLGQGQVT
jgi:hypothetical protein